MLTMGWSVSLKGFQANLQERIFKYLKACARYFTFYLCRVTAFESKLFNGNYTTSEILTCIEKDSFNNY